MKRNPILLAARCYRAWKALRVYPGVFSFGDACKSLRYVLQPGRLTEREMRRFIGTELNIRELPDGAHEVGIKRNGLMFFWPGRISSGLAGGVLQELDQRNPHYSTTPPVRLESSSVVLDVGACEGLFALRIAKGKEAGKVICFEPSGRIAAYLRQAAVRNGVSALIEVENCAVGRLSQKVFFKDSDNPEANHVCKDAADGATVVHQVSLDDYCRDKGIRLRPLDLIKVDAEGADMDVIAGAERIIREGSPQIAVTTYHDPQHAARLIDFLRRVQPRYQLRLKGMTLWEQSNQPRPVLLQAALPATP